MNEQPPRPVFLITDFGTEDPYVGLMKSVLLKDPPYPPIVDLSHEVQPQNETNAAFLLEYCLPDLPTEAVVLLVVDPQVGTDRSIIAVQTETQKCVVAPDTGIVNGLECKRARTVTNDELARSVISSTFHGRDWFAPVGRFLSHRGDFSRLGPEKSVPSSQSRVPSPEFEDSELQGTIVHVDHFGNLISNISRDHLKKIDTPGRDTRVRIQIAGRTITGIARTYAKATGLTGVFGSFDRLEVALPNGSAASLLETGIGKELSVRMIPSPSPSGD